MIFIEVLLLEIDGKILIIEHHGQVSSSLVVQAKILRE